MKNEQTYKEALQKILEISTNKFIHDIATEALAVAANESNQLTVGEQVAQLHESPKNWVLDMKYENGNYWCKCIDCSSPFIGFKQRHLCHECSEKNTIQTISPKSVEATESLNEQTRYYSEEEVNKILDKHCIANKWWLTSNERHTILNAIKELQSLSPLKEEQPISSVVKEYPNETPNGIDIESDDQLPY